MADETFILVHSPLVGPSTWSPVAQALEQRGHRATVPSLLGVRDSRPPHWRWCVDRLVQAIAGAQAPIALVAHSGPGPLLPIVGVEAGPKVRCYVFVDATIPARGSSTPVVPSEFLASLETRADGGWMPKWSQWWGDEAMRKLVPDEAMRRHLEAEMPSLPLTYFREAIPVPPGWPDAPCSYLQFSTVYEPVAEDAGSRGWRTRRIVGEHLHMVVEPGPVAETIIDLAQPTFD